MNVVLAHGFLGFSEVLGVEYFNGVKQKLENYFGPSLKVFVSQVPGAASIDERGKELSNQIRKALDSGRLDSKQKVHIIAHSMGGLDARLMISENIGNIAAQIRSLSTIGTPHRGSPIADLIMSGLHDDHLLRQIIETLGIPIIGLNDLTTQRATAFDQEHRDRDGVQYNHIAGKGREVGLPTCALLLVPHSRIKQVTGGDEENDGLVSFSSATRGNVQGAVIWPADHADEIGHNLDGFSPLAQPANFDYLTEYTKIVAALPKI